MKDFKESITSLFKTENEKKYCKNAIDTFLTSDCYRYLCGYYNDKHFSFSMSELKDSMQFWRQDYACENGIALGFNKSRYEEESEKNLSLGKIQYLDMETVEFILHEFMDTIRKEAEYINHINEFNDDGTPHYDMSGSFVLTKSPFWLIKNKVWSSEQEWRLVKTIKSLNIAMEKRRKKDYKLPYEIGNDFKPRYKAVLQNPFDEIILGPAFPDTYVDYIKDWLRQQHYDIKNVSKSLGRERSKIEI